jgi:dephospho-CoA kinase
MFVIGLTGGVASGKSAVAACFIRRGVTVVDADQVSRDVVAPGQPLLQELTQLAGDEILDDQGALDRGALRQRLFADAALRHAVEALLHPAIAMAMGQQLALAQGPYAMLMVPLLVETGGEKMVDRVLVVDCPEALQLERLMARDTMTKEGAAAMLAAQATREQRLAKADDVIDNTGPLDVLDRAAEALHALYGRMATDLPLRKIHVHMPRDLHKKI